MAKLLEEGEVLFFEGDNYAKESFTELVRKFLETDPRNLAVAFKQRGAIPGLHASWWEIYRDFGPDRLIIFFVFLR